MANFQTRKCNSHIMSSAIVSMFNESMRGISLNLEIVSMKLLNDKKNVVGKKPNYNSKYSLSCFDCNKSNFLF